MDIVVAWILVGMMFVVVGGVGTLIAWIIRGDNVYKRSD